MQKDIDELVANGIITQESAARIRAYYAAKQPGSGNRLLVAFGVLGALLIGLGIILIIAHNWDELPRWFKTVLAFAPLLIGQLFCAYALFKKEQSAAWMEGTAAFLFMAVGACISLISQVYNISGNLSAFLLAWMLLCAPLIYVMRSSVASLLFLTGITYYACETGYWSRYDGGNPHFFWLLLIIVLPHYYRLYTTAPESNFLRFHHRMVPVAILIVLGTVAKSSEEFMTIAYMSLFGFFYLAGSALLGNNNDYSKLGTTGTVLLFIALSFRWFWEELPNHHLQWISPELLTALVVTLLAAAMFFYKHNRMDVQPFSVFDVAFLVFIPVFFLGYAQPLLGMIATNIIVLLMGILTVAQGAKQQELSTLNFGLLTIAALIACRFFDTNMSFVLRGVLFVLVGAGFFAANYVLLQKKKSNDR